MYLYRIINEETQECASDSLFDKDKCIEKAKDMRKASKDKAHFRVVALLPVWSTKEREEQAPIDF